MKNYLFENLDHNFSNLFQRLGKSVKLDSVLPLPTKSVHSHVKSDKEALENDWLVVGEEVRKAIGRFDNEYASAGSSKR